MASNTGAIRCNLPSRACGSGVRLDAGRSWLDRCSRLWEDHQMGPLQPHPDVILQGVLAVAGDEAQDLGAARQR